MHLKDSLIKSRLHEEYFTGNQQKTANKFALQAGYFVPASHPEEMSFHFFFLFVLSSFFLSVSLNHKVFLNHTSSVNQGSYRTEID